ncbi:hypothetical protein [Yoonia sp. SS1-5]|uniref:Uncharacterized protein n=1 Tax=Yoonia rhodophyticola TaxID=3137370 RepID=A0AAN0MIU9_9RHOB
MMRKLPLVAFGVVAACTVPDLRPLPAPPPAPPVIQPAPVPIENPQSAKQRFLRAAAANGCEVNAQTTPTILASATLSQDDLARVLQDLRNEGGVDLVPGQGFRVTSGACA